MYVSLECLHRQKEHIQHQKDMKSNEGIRFDDQKNKQKKTNSEAKKTKSLSASLFCIHYN